MGNDDAPDLRHAGRYEWEQIIRRARLTGLVQGTSNGTRGRGGISGPDFKAVALTWASYADPDGSRIFPGDATLAVEAEVSFKTAKAVKAKLIELGLTVRVRAGARRKREHDEYQLTLPTDLLDRLDILTPAQVRLAAEKMRVANRGRTGSGGPHRTPAIEGPPDPPKPVDNSDVEGPADPTHHTDDNGCKGSTGTAPDECRGSTGTVVGGPLEPRSIDLATTDHQEHRPPVDSDLRTDVAVVARASPEQDQISGGGGDVDRDPARALTDAEAQTLRAAGEPVPRCEHGMANVLRTGDGTHACALCRRQLRAAARAAGPPLPANVVPFRRPQTA